MKLVEFKNYELTVPEEVWGLKTFKKLLDRDKTKDKTKSNKEMLFIFHYSDIRSDFMHILDDKEKIEAVKEEAGLNKSWKIDKDVQKAIDLYKELSTTVIEQLYFNSVRAASDVGTYLSRTKDLLEERDQAGKPVYDIAKITTAVQKVPKLMADLKEAYQEVVKEKESIENKKKGSRKFNLFEDGI
ncbi:MAG: hypothetical protein ACTH0S_06605 [Senegalia sp. (in: firmicutes)]